MGGAISIIAAIFAAALIVAALGALDVGNVFLARRQLQRTADMAAIAGAEAINSAASGAPAGTTAGCWAAQTAATASAASNGSASTPAVVCGRWDPVMTPASPYFSSTVAANVPQNAVQVTVSRNVSTLLLGKSHTVRAMALAKATNTASFSLSTQAASVSGGVVNALLQQTLGSSINLQVGDYTNLVGGQIKLLDLVNALYTQHTISVASVSSLLGANVSVGSLLSAMQTALTKNGTVASTNAATALGKLSASVSGSLAVNVNKFLAVTLANPDNAASAYVNALDVVTNLALATGTSQIDLTAAFTQNSATPSLLPNMLLTGSTIKLVVGTPPKIVIGEAGKDASGNWRTTAHTADIALFADLKVSTTPTLLAGILGSPLSIELPVYVEGFQATAPLQSTQCGATPNTSNMVVNVSPGIAHAIISNDIKTLMASSPTTANYQTYMAAPTYAQPASVLTLSLGSIPLLATLKGTLAALSVSLPNVSLAIGGVPNASGAPTQGYSLNVAPPGNQTLTFTGAGSLNAFLPLSGQANSNQVGAQAGDLVGQLVSAVSSPSPVLYATVGPVSMPLSLLNLGTVLQSVLTQALGPLGYLVGGLLSPVLNTVLSPLSNVLTSIATLVLQPLLTALDTLLVPLLQLLGVQIGIATVHGISLQCGDAQLVE